MVFTMEKQFRMYVTNITQAINVLQNKGIRASAEGSSIKVNILEQQKTDVILLLNKEKVIIYDIEEL